MHPLKKVLMQNKKGMPVGVCSICSSNKYVIETAMEEASKYNSPLLIESTANQVNQYGGYTGMNPLMFRSYVYKIAEKAGFNPDSVILGGDHLGPLIWNNEVAETAMRKAEELVAAYVKAGFTKIHLDCSMKISGDPDGGPSPATVAERGARLCSVAEEAFQNSGGEERPVYVIGSEVPIPGGTKNNDGLKVTDPKDFAETVELFKKSFLKRGLTDAWNNVIAVVVQPGVEYGSNTVHDYCRGDSVDLCGTLKNYPSIVFEGHSTDYQKQSALRQMVEDGIAILKVGPALTFALREGLFSLSAIENDLFDEGGGRSCFQEVLEKTMLEKPGSWTNYYHGSSLEKKLARKYSYSDRCRYYLNEPDVDGAVGKLIANLRSMKIPMPLISQYFPEQYWKIRNGQMKADPLELVKGNIKITLDKYYEAVTLDGKKLEGVSI